MAGIKTYFDKVLGNLLLYRFERQQYVDIRKKNNGKEDSEIYGGEHLLRLFGKGRKSVEHGFLRKKDVANERCIDLHLFLAIGSAIPDAYRPHANGSGFDQRSARKSGRHAQVRPRLYMKRRLLFLFISHLY